jgi:hypothetical protein
LIKDPPQSIERSAIQGNSEIKNLMRLLTRFHSLPTFQSSYTTTKKSAFGRDTTLSRTPHSLGDGKRVAAADWCSQMNWQLVLHGMSYSLPDPVATEHRPADVRPLIKSGILLLLNQILSC